MFDGLFGPWHLIIVAVVVFLVVGPRRLTSSLRGTVQSVQQLVDPDEHPPTPAVADADVRPRRLSYRLGRRLRRRGR